MSEFLAHPTSHITQLQQRSARGRYFQDSLFEYILDTRVFPHFPNIDQDYIRDILRPIYFPQMYETSEFFETLQYEYDISTLAGIKQFTEYLTTSPVHAHYSTEFLDLQEQIQERGEIIASYHEQIQHILTTKNKKAGSKLLQEIEILEREIQLLQQNFVQKAVSLPKMYDGILE